VVFTTIVILSSFVTTWLIGNVDEATIGGGFGWSWIGGYGYWVSPWDVLKDLIRAVYRLMVEQDLLEEHSFTSSSSIPRQGASRTSQQSPGLFQRLFKRFVLGLPVVGAGSLIQMLLSMNFLVPVQRLARFRGDRSRRNNGRDLAALVLVVLILVGIVRSVPRSVLVADSC
jgi:hypothetical protein